MDYALIKPEDLAAKINPTDAEIKAAYEKNRSRYQVLEKRVVRYALLDTTQMRHNIQITDDQLKAQYQANIQQYQVPNRVHVEHILLMTVGKTDAEVEEIKKTAEDVLQAGQRRVRNSKIWPRNIQRILARRTRAAIWGGSLRVKRYRNSKKPRSGWIKDRCSGLVNTQYGFHIIKVLDKETARTKTFDEVKESLARSHDAAAGRPAGQRQRRTSCAKAIRKSNKVSLDDLAKQYHLTVSETRPVSAVDPVLELGNSKEVKDAIFRLRQNELSLPLRTDRGYVVLSVKQIISAHQGSLEEVREQVVNELKQEESTKLAKIEGR